MRVMRVERLGRGWEPSLRALLLGERVTNLFLLGFLEAHPLDRTCWYGAVDGGHLLGVVLVVPEQLCVPFCPEPAHAAAVGEILRHTVDPCMMVGPRAACDALWGTWAPSAVPECWYDQRLYVLRDPPPGDPVPGFRAARMSEWRTLAINAARMELEDLRRNPADPDPTVHERVVRGRIRSGKTWVIEHDGEIVFQVNLGTSIDLGCQVGGTYVPPAHRGHGLATAGMRALGRHLLEDRPCVTLHVNEANGRAVRAYERAGFTRDVPMRLATVRPR